MNNEFAGKSALVTGAGSGLGRVTALALARAGAVVTLVDVNEAGLAETKSQLQAAGGRCATLVVDVSSQPACAEAVRSAVATWGKLDVLCNIAGILAMGPTKDVTAEQWQRVLAVNLSGPFYLSQAALPHLLKVDGAIVNVASTAAHKGQAYMPAYTASKAGLVSLTQSLAMEYMNQPVRINAVSPGGMNTPMAQGLDLPEGADIDMALIQRYMPTRGVLPPEDIADMILYLASARAKSIHGAVVAIDGGMTAG